MTTTQDAQKLAEQLDDYARGDEYQRAIDDAAAMLRELSEQVEALRTLPLADDHNGTRVDYTGLLGQSQRVLKHSSPGTAEMLRQLTGHIKEMGARFYAGEVKAVDEFLQLYCVEHEARAALKQGESK